MTEGTHFDANARKEAAASANAEDAAVWRWFSNLYDQGLIRWCRTHRGWLISVAHRHVATTATFDEGIREAMARTQDTGNKRMTKNRTRRGEEELR
jgi:hypothetical protein